MNLQRPVSQDFSKRDPPSPPATGPTPAESDPEDLLTLYFKLSVKERKERFATTAFVAKKCGVSQRTVEYWITNGLIEAVPIGGKYQVDLRSLKKFLRQLAQQREMI